MYRDIINNEYFEWIYNLVCGDKRVSFRYLLRYLHDTEFVYTIPRDENRIEDGIGLRRRYALRRNDMSIERYLNGPCSVLEMMVALAVYCEESIMDDPTIGDRTGQWFWGMVVSLGLGSMTDDRFDMHYAEDVITRFLSRNYQPNGKGGLFTIKNCDVDLRNVEIWYQLCWYLDSIM